MRIVRSNRTSLTSRSICWLRQKSGTSSNSPNRCRAPARALVWKRGADLISSQARALLTATERIINCNSEMDALLMPLQSDGAIGTALQGSPNSGKRTNLAFAKSSKGSGLVRAGTEPVRLIPQPIVRNNSDESMARLPTSRPAFGRRNSDPSGESVPRRRSATPPRRNSDVGSGGLFGSLPG